MIIYVFFCRMLNRKPAKTCIEVSRVFFNTKEGSGKLIHRHVILINSHHKLAVQCDPDVYENIIALSYKEKVGFNFRRLSHITEYVK